MPETPEHGGSDEPVGRRTFSTSFRGFDQGEVRAYLELLADEFAKLKSRIADLEADLDRASEVTPQPMDIATLTSALGDETAKVLRTAQQAAEELRIRAEEGAARTLKEAQEEASRLRSSAESLLADRTSEAERASEQLRREAAEAAARMREEAAAESEAVIAQAVTTGRDMVGQAQAARERVLADLARRRKAALTQLEALRAGREELLASFVAARSQLDQIVDDVDQADEQARAAAEMVGRSTAKAAARAAGSEPAGSEPAEPAPDPAAQSMAEPAGEPMPELTPEPTAGVIPEPTMGPMVEATLEPTGGLTPELTPDAVAEAVTAAMAEVDVATAPDTLADVAATTGEPEPSAFTPEPLTDEPAVEEPPTEPRLDEPVPEGLVEAADTTTVDADAPGEEVGEIGTGDGAPGDAADGDLAVAPLATDASADAQPLRQPYPHDPVPAAVMTGPSVGDPPAGGRVDRLFAQIRADRAGAVQEARDLLAQPEPVEAATPFPEDAGLEAPRSDADESYLQRRDVLIEVGLGTTTRALKRALADDQNGTLERLRTVPNDAGVSALVEAEDVQVRAWARRATPGLIDGAAAGAKLAEGGEGEAPKFDPETVGAIADRLAGELVLPLRRRLLEVLEAAGDDRGADTMDRVNSVFREWRGRVDRAVADAVTESVSAGFVAAVEPGTSVRWVVEDADGPCPDCDDNALSGATPIGEPFPTGQIAPPAHPGCRCVLALST